MKAVSSFFFISKVLRKTILAMRMNAIQAKFTGANGRTETASRLLSSAFKAFRLNWDLNKRIKQFKAQRLDQSAHKAFCQWHDEAQRNKYFALIIKTSEQKRALCLAKQFFDLLRSVDCEKVQKYRMSRLWRAWRYQIQRHALLKQKQAQIEFVHKQVTKHCMLREWRQALFTSFALHKIALPYERTILIKRAFYALKRVTVHKAKARMFARRSLLFKTLRSLTMHQMNEVKVKSMQKQINDRKLTLVFDAFID